MKTDVYCETRLHLIKDRTDGRGKEQISPIQKELQIHATWDSTGNTVAIKNLRLC